VFIVCGNCDELTTKLAEVPPFSGTIQEEAAGKCTGHCFPEGLNARLAISG